MKKNLKTEIKKLNTLELQKKVAEGKSELAVLALDKNMRKLKDLKVISKKRKDIAYILTVLRQKELLDKLEIGVKK